MNDKEALLRIANDFGVEIMQKSFGLSPVLAKFTAKTAINNLMENYEVLINAFFNKSGNIDTTELFTALKEELKARNGFKIGKVKINPEIIDELMCRFEALKQANP